MSGQVGNKRIDVSLIVCTVLMFYTFPFFFSYSEVFPYETMIILWQLVVGTWALVFVAFLLSRAQINRHDIEGINEIWDDNQVPSPEKSSGSSFIIPSYCPYCHAPIVLENTYWVDEGKLVCPECNNSILVRVVEDI
jgi:hypothetical protein